MPYKIHNNFTKESIKESLQKNYKTVTEENLDISIMKLISITTTSTHTFYANSYVFQNYTFAVNISQKMPLDSTKLQRFTTIIFSTSMTEA